MSKAPSPLKNNRGVALLITIVSIMMMSLIVIQVSETTVIEYAVSTQNLNRIRAHYAARAGIEFGLLRVLLYQKAENQLGDKLKDQPDLLDLIWQLPMNWPPEVSPNVSGPDREEMLSDIKESYIKARNHRFIITITTEDSKIDVNDLVSPSKTIAESTKKQILQIFLNKMERDEEFEDKYRGTDFEEIVNNIIDWMDEDGNALQGGPEATLYDGDYGDSIPPNEPFKTIEELRMVAGMTEEFYQVMLPRITIYGAQGINVNQAGPKMLKEIVPELTDEQVDELLKYRAGQVEGEEGGPFADIEAFENYLFEDLRVDADTINPQKIPLHFGKKYNFRVTSTGQYANVARDIEVVTYDFTNIANSLSATIIKEAKEEKGASEEGEQPPQEPEQPENPNDLNQDDQNQEEKKKDEPKETKSPPPKGKPMIIYWSET